MTDQAVAQIVAVLAGGVVAIASGFLTTFLVENRRQAREAHNLALAFRGEIGALLAQMRDRGYQVRFREIAAQIENTSQPFYMPMRIRFRYDRVYEANVARLGMLARPLPEQIPLFYTQLNSVLEDLVNLGDGAYADLELAALVRIYRELDRILGSVVALGEEISAAIDAHYG